MKKFIPLSALFLLIMFLTGCMNVAIEGDGLKTPDSKFEKETVYGTFYGFNWDDNSRIVKKNQNGLGLYKVEYNTNVVYSIISIVSVGLLVPVDIDYWVEAPHEIKRIDKF